MARSTNAAEQPNWAALKQLHGAGISPQGIRRLAHSTPDQRELATVRSRGNPTQNNWAVDTRRREANERGEGDRDADDRHPNRQAAIPFRAGTVRNNADPGPWGGLLNRVVGPPKMPRVRQS